jgi:hypothetical protein
MLHHNVLEHLPGQTQSALGRRYMVQNHGDIIQRLEAAGVRLMFTGHLHVQDVARRGQLCEVLTGSLVSYPHPYRVVEIEQGDGGLAHGGAIAPSHRCAPLGRSAGHVPPVDVRSRRGVHG